MEDTRTRLRSAALALFDRQGYERTTAAQIAAQAGATERTFFRHFPDKREVLFEGEARVRDVLIDAIAEAPTGISPLDTLHRAFKSLEPMHETQLPYLLLRHRILSETPALYERELAKLAALAKAVAAALRIRGVPDLRAELSAQIATAAFVEATHSWLERPDVGLRRCLSVTFDVLKTILSDRGEDE